MMAVVVHHQSLAALRQLDFAIALETTADTGKSFQTAADGFFIDTTLQGHTDGGQCIQHIVAAGQIEDNVERTRLMAFQPRMDGKLHLRANAFHIRGVNVGTVVQPVSRMGFADFRQDGADMLAVDTQKCFTVEWHTVNKIHEGLMKFFDAVAVSVHMVFVDIGYYRHQRREV